MTGGLEHRPDMPRFNPPSRYVQKSTNEYINKGNKFLFLPFSLPLSLTDKLKNFIEKPSGHTIC